MSHTFDVGQKLKCLRKERGFTLKGLSSKAGVSATQISEIERNRTSPTFATLMKLISALGQDTSLFFEKERTKRVALVRKSERSVIVDQKHQVMVQSLTTGIVDSRLKVIIVHPKPGKVNIPGGYEHPGEELIYVIKGRIEVKLAGKPYILEQGDCIHFRGEMNHQIKNIEREAGEVLAVITPPSY